MIPQATFGNCLDLDRYDASSRAGSTSPSSSTARPRSGPATSTTGSSAPGSTLPIVFTMHATKAFATDEGGLVYAARTELVDDVRYDEQLRVRDARQATMPGLEREVERGRGPARAGEAHRARRGAVGHPGRPARRLPGRVPGAAVPAVPVGRGRRTSSSRHALPASTRRCATQLVDRPRGSRRGARDVLRARTSRSSPTSRSTLRVRRHPQHTETCRRRVSCRCHCPTTWIGARRRRDRSRASVGGGGR